MKTVLVGDIHEKKCYFNAKYLPDNSICVGDLAMDYNQWLVNNLYRDGWQSQKRFFISGNHENYTKLKENNETIYMLRDGLYHIPRFFLSGTTLFIGGADSIDKSFRVEGLDWFPEEYISYTQFNNAMERLSDKKVDTIVAHDIPSLFYSEIGIYNHMNHSMALSEIFKHFKPTRWFCGHHHISTQFNQEGCQVRILGIAEKVEVYLDVNQDDFISQ